MITITFCLDLEEPVLISSPSRDPNTNETLPFIPGSVIRGALAHRYRREHLADEGFARLFLNGQTRFLHAYPVNSSGKRALPTPQSWVAAKDSPSDQRIYYLERKEDKPDSQRVVPGPFFHWLSPEGSRVTWYESLPVYTEMAVHTARNRQMGRALPDDDESALFRYQALARGQQFVGAIVLEHGDDAALIQSLLKGGSLLLGRSHTAGYGLTRVKAVTEESRWQEGPWSSAGIAANQPFTLFLTSDCVVRHPDTGQTGNYVAEALSALWSIPCKQEGNFSRMSWLGSFNNFWGLPTPQEWALKAGTVLRLTAAQAINTQQVQDLVSQGLGERLTEGYGRLLVNPVWPDRLVLPTAEELEEERETMARKEGIAAPTLPTLTAVEQDIVQRLNQRLARQTLERHLIVAAQDIARGFKGPLSNSQLARLRLQIRPKPQQSDANTLNTFRAYLVGVQKRKTAYDQFQRSRLHNKNFYRWLDELAEKPQKVWQEMKLVDEDGRPDPGAGWFQKRIGYQPFTLTPEWDSRYAIRLIEAVCVQIAAARRQMP